MGVQTTLVPFRFITMLGHFLAALLEGRTMSLRTGATPRPEARAEKKT